MGKSNLNEACWLIPRKINTPVIPGDIIKSSASDQELHNLLTGNYIRNRIKMKQDTWQPLNDMWSRPIDKDGIFIDQYGLTVSLSVTDGFKSAFLVVLSLPR